MRRTASSKGFVRGGRVATTDVDRAIGGLDQALRTELAGEAGAEATRHCVVCSGRGGRAGELCTTAKVGCAA